MNDNQKELLLPTCSSDQSGAEIFQTETDGATCLSGNESGDFNATVNVVDPWTVPAEHIPDDEGQKQPDANNDSMSTRLRIAKTCTMAFMFVCVVSIIISALSPLYKPLTNHYSHL